MKDHSHSEDHHPVRFRAFPDVTYHKYLSNHALSRTLEVEAEPICKALKDIPHRYPALEPDLECNLLISITQKGENTIAVNRARFLHYCQEGYNAALTRGWVDSFLH
jgi:hypothetical protein